MTNANFFNFNDADEQQSFDVIPDNTPATVQLNIRHGGVGEGGWLKRAKDGNSQHLACECVIVDGPHAKRKFPMQYTVDGTTQGHAEAKEISRKTFRAMLESARGIRPDDMSDAAKAKRQAQGYQDLDKLRFVARIGVIPPKDGFRAKNVIREVITPERQGWRKPDQIDRDVSAKPATTAAPAQAPADAIGRPQWAQPEKK